MCNWGNSPLLGSSCEHSWAEPSRDQRIFRFGSTANVGWWKKSSVPATGKSVQLLYGRCSKHVQTAWSSQMSKGALDEHPSTIFGWLSPPSWGPQFLWWVKRRAGIPSGKQPHNYGKSLFLMGKSTISMVSIAMFVYQRVHDLLRIAVPPWKRHRGTIWMCVSNNMKAVISQLKVGFPKAI